MVFSVQELRKKKKIDERFLFNCYNDTLGYKVNVESHKKKKGTKIKESRRERETVDLSFWRIRSWSDETNMVETGDVSISTMENDSSGTQIQRQTLAYPYFEGGLATL